MSSLSYIVTKKVTDDDYADACSEQAEKYLIKLEKLPDEAFKELVEHFEDLSKRFKQLEKRAEQCRDFTIS